ncbi:MAG: hypothetical protein IKE69_02770 [Thermoguttaceae bacterium]|nr:hypothetical protein [Thermoguttaceae bacterium]
MNFRKMMAALLLCGGASLFLTGCGETSAVKPDGSMIFYRYDKSDPTGPDTAVLTASAAPAAQLTDLQMKLAKVYDQRVKAKEDAQKKAAAARAAKARAAAAAKEAEKPKASPADMKAAEELVASLKGSVKKGKGGAIIGLTMAASSVASQDEAAAAPEGDAEQDAPEPANLTAEDMELIGRLADLESVSFEGSAFDDETCAPLANLKKLNHVTINNANIGDATLEMLATLPELTYLDIRRDLKLANASLEILQKMPKLTELHAHYNSFTNSGMNKIAKVKTLKVVDVRGCSDVSDNGAKYLARLPEIEQLYFRFMITNAGVEYLAAAPNLKYVEFQDCNDINAGAVEAFKKMPALTGIRIFRCKGFDDETLRGLAARQLERLELRDLNISNAGIAALKDQQGLKTVEFSELASVDAAGLTDLLGSLKGITKMSFFTIPLTNEGVAKIVENNPEMSEFAARAVTIDDGAIDHILKFQKLTVLDLRSNNGVSADAYLRLGQMKSLKTLYLKDTTITAKGNEAQLAELKKALPKTRIVEN